MEHLSLHCPQKIVATEDSSALREEMRTLEPQQDIERQHKGSQPHLEADVVAGTPQLEGTRGGLGTSPVADVRLHYYRRTGPCSRCPPHPT